MSEETDVKLRCLQIVAEASSRIGQYSPGGVLDQAKSLYEWVKDGGQRPEVRGRKSEVSKKKFGKIS